MAWDRALRRGSEPALPAADLARRLTAIEEIDRYDAAYRLGAMGEAAVPMLIDALRREGASRVEANIERSHTNQVQFDTAYGLTAAGAAHQAANGGVAGGHIHSSLRCQFCSNGIAAYQNTFL